VVRTHLKQYGLVSSHLTRRILKWVLATPYRAGGVPLKCTHLHVTQPVLVFGLLARVLLTPEDWFIRGMVPQVRRCRYPTSDLNFSSGAFPSSGGVAGAFVHYTPFVGVPLRRW
jgi:hypothetical protein